MATADLPFDQRQLKEIKLAFDLACRDLDLGDADAARRRRLSEMIFDLAKLGPVDCILLKRKAVDRFHRLGR